MKHGVDNKCNNTFFFFANLIVVDIYFEAKQEYACTFTYISNLKKEFKLKI